MPPVMYGIPEILTVYVEHKPQSNVWKWTSPEALDGEENDIIFNFSGDLMDKPWFSTNVNEDDSFTLTFDKSRIKEGDSGSYDLEL